MPLLSIIVLSYNTSDVTCYCLQSIIENYKNELKKKDIEVIIVDNASSDDSVEQIRKLIAGWEAFALIESQTNMGFAKGNNFAIKHAKGEYIVFLNSDTQVLDKGFLKMIDFLRNHPEVGILGTKFITAAGQSQKSAGKFYTIWNATFMLFGKEHLVRFSPNTISKVDWVSGGCMLLKKSLFEKLRGFDEHFFMYMEDMEICYRLKQEKLSVYFFPDAKVTHIGEASSDRSFAIVHIYKGLLYFYKKHRNAVEYIFIQIMLGIKAVIGISVGLITGNIRLKNTYLQALRTTL